VIAPRELKSYSHNQVASQAFGPPPLSKSKWTLNFVSFSRCFERSSLEFTCVWGLFGAARGLTYIGSSGWNLVHLVLSFPICLTSSKTIFRFTKFAGVLAADPAKLYKESLSQDSHWVIRIGLACRIENEFHFWLQTSWNWILDLRFVEVPANQIETTGYPLSGGTDLERLPFLRLGGFWHRMTLE